MVSLENSRVLTGRFCAEIDFNTLKPFTQELAIALQSNCELKVENIHVQG